MPRGPGRMERIDYEYERAGVANVFMLFVPLEGKRYVSVRERRTAKDYAEVVRELVDVHFPLAEKIILVNEQSQHPQNSLIVQGIPTCRGPPHRGTHRDALHPKTWVLAQYGRMRTQRTLPTMPRPAHP